MQPLNLLIAALAVWHVVEVFHHGSVFATVRARLELSERFFARMMLCPFCLSVWAAFVATPFALPRIEPTKHFDDQPLVWAWYGLHGFGFMAMVAFAIARLANLGNDLTSEWCRTPGRKGLGPDSNSTIEKSDEQPERPAAGPGPGAAD